MIKKLTLLLALSLGWISAAAQHTPGSWKIIPMAGEFFESVIDTPEKVYYLTGGSLYSYDKEYNETLYYTPGTQISDSGIASLHYNTDNHYLMVVYSNGNIDLIYDDGKVVNMPEIKTANLTTGKSVNSVFFANNRIYIATEFGLVIYDDQKHAVAESAIYGGKGMSIAMANKDYLFTVIDYKLCYSPLSERHNSLDKFTPMSGVSIDRILPLDDVNFLYVVNKAIYKMLIDVPNGFTFQKVVDVPGLTSFYRTKDGYMALSDNGLTVLDANGDLVETKAIAEELSDNTLGSHNGLKEVWAANHDGIGCYDLTGATPTVLSERYRPEASIDFGAGFCTPSPDGASVYVTHRGMSEVHPAGDSGWSQHLPFICERYDWATGSIVPVYPYGVRNTSKESQVEADLRNSKLFYGGPSATVIDPVDPDLIYHVNNFEGLVLVKDRQVLRELTNEVIPINFVWGQHTELVAFDPFGNLWIGGWAKSTATPFAVLSSEGVNKLRNDPYSIDKSDFEVPAWPSTDHGKLDMRMIFVPNTNKMFYIRGGWSGTMIGGDTRGTTSCTDDVFVVYSGLEDQDGIINTPQFLPCMEIDKENNIWIGTTSGIFILKDKTQLGVSGASNLKVVRTKVSRNDGTNYADYLLSSETVLAIAVDPSNRKWVATQASGLYLVSADGTEILEHFDMDNSPLISNTVYTVACDPAGNDVLIGTPTGFYLYSSTSAPAADDYSEVYAFPNPVRPDYTGWITINGLMDNSLVKIADMQGNVLWEGRSEGGMVVWDGCNRDGSRVRTGVYMVLASQGVDGSSEGAVTKIVVVN